MFAVDVLECPRCHGRLELIAYIAEAAVARRILDHLGLASQAPPLAPARRGEPDESCDAGPDHGGRLNQHGGGAHDLVDELRLLVYPIVLGSGKRLFGESNQKLSLHLVNTRTLGDSLAHLNYELTKPQSNRW